MEKIDWSKAPEGAEFWCDDQWFKVVVGEWFTWYPGALSWAKPAYNAPDNFSWWGSAVERPQPSAWNGQGLPPVGTVCEMHHDAWQPNNWPKVTVKYASAEYLITEDGAGEQHWHAHSVKFRQIRTPEQIAADERDESVISVFRLIKENGWDIQSDDADYLYFLYDSGLLKKAS